MCGEDGDEVVLFSSTWLGYDESRMKNDDQGGMCFSSFLMH